MAASSAQKELEEELTTYGMKLINPPSSTDELLKLLDKVESLLTMVGQCPSDSMERALQPVMEALSGEELLRSNNEDVNVSAVSCITELLRITAPKHPYDDSQMKDILQQTVMVLHKLSDVTASSYYKAVRILETVAALRACVMLLDLEYYSLVNEIFKLFLGVIRPYHPQNVFNKMKNVMTQLIEDSDELSVELLQPLLDSVKKKNQIASPVSSKLGEKVLEDCAAIVKPYLAKALKSMNLNPDDCAEIVASMCNESPNGEEIMAIDYAPDTATPVKVGPSNAKFGETVLQDVMQMEQPKDTCTTNITRPDNPEDMQPRTNAEIASVNSKLTGGGGQDSLASQNDYFSDGSHDNLSQPKKKQSMTNEDVHLDVVVPEGDEPQSEVTKVGSLQLGLTSGKGIKHTVYARRKPGMGSRKKESASNCDAVTKSELSIKSEEGNITNDKDPSPQLIDGKKNNKTATKMHDIEESGDKDYKRPRTLNNYGEDLVGARIKVWWPADEMFYEGTISSFDPVKKRHKIIYVDGDKERLNLHEERWEILEDSSSEKDSKRPRTIKFYGEELVGTRIKIWWPADEQFYEGVCSSFDPVKQKHTIIYVDGDKEILNLHEERWEILEDNSSEKNHGTEFQSPAVLSVTSTKKKAKRNSSPKNEADIVTYSKRSSTKE